MEKIVVPLLVVCFLAVTLLEKDRIKSMSFWGFDVRF